MSLLLVLGGTGTAVPVEPWQPGDAWPGTPGGAAREEWGGYTRLYVQAAITAGSRFAIGAATHDRLDAGNVLSAALTRDAGPETTWVDLTCDLVDLELTLGSSSGAGILSKSDAGTLVATLYDPTGKYDPLNPETVYSLAGRTRLVPGVPVRAWCEVIEDPDAGGTTVATFPLFAGTADRWSEEWTREPSERRAKLVATDPTKTWVRADQPALPAPVGAGDTPAQRLQRIADNFGWTGSIAVAAPTVTTLGPSTLAAASWELANRVANDELGFAYFAPQTPAATAPGVLTIIGRTAWTTRPAPAVSIGCGPGLYDIATDVHPASFDTQLRNAAYVARTGGTQQTAEVASSIARYWEASIDRTDLGVADDTQAAAWATAIVTLMAYPQASIDTATLRPDLDPAPWDAWRAVLAVPLVTALVRVLWEAAGYTADTQARVVGWRHKITATRWEVEWRTVSAAVSAAAVSFHTGPHRQDVLDAGYVMA